MSVRFKYYLRGCGLGILVASLVFIVSLHAHGGAMSDEKAMQRASELGMIMPDDTQTQEAETQTTELPVKETNLPDTQRTTQAVTQKVPQNDTQKQTERDTSSEQNDTPKESEKKAEEKKKTQDSQKKEEEKKKAQETEKEETKKEKVSITIKGSFYAFEMLYWCGIREGELLALTAADFNFDKETVTINKSYQRLHGEDVITTPKTKKSNRTIKMPHFLCEEMQEYLGMLYGLKKKDRIFTVTKSYLHHEMDRGAEAAGVKRIRIHDLRHSHISLLIDMGFSAVAIADRVGHESIDITYQYAHMLVNTDTMVMALDTSWGMLCHGQYD